MPIDLMFIKEKVTEIINNYSDLAENQELKQKEIKNSLETLRTFQEPIINSIKTNILENSPTDNRPEIAPLEERLAILNQYFHLSLACGDTLEELGFNSLLYKLDNPIDLYDFLDNLKGIINKFKNMDIIINDNSFSYTYLVHKFMAKYMENIDSPDLNTTMKVLFDKMYWKNHFLLTDIAINVRDIYKDNQKLVTDYANRLKVTFIRNYKIDEKNIRKEFDKTFADIINLSKISANRIFDLFNNKVFKIADYQDDSAVLLAHRSRFITPDDYKKFSTREEDEFYLNLEELDFNLYEYENYEKYKFLIDEIKKSLEKKGSIASEITAKNKNILKLKQTNIKNSKKIARLSQQKEAQLLRNNIPKVTKLSPKIDNLILTNDNVLEQIRMEYSNYDELIFIDKICKNVHDQYTVYDIFKLFRHDLNSFRRALVKKDNEIIPEEEINDLTTQFVRFMEDPRIKIINTINYLNLVEVGTIIEEKYKLSGINISIKKIDTQEYKDLRNSCGVLSNYNFIYRSGWTPYLLKARIDFFEE